jgi:outer membrane protein OmpA-like peptidoglycan-associated protein
LKSFRCLIGSFLIAACVAMLPTPAMAQFPDHALYIGAYGGGNLKPHDWSLGSNADKTVDRSLQPKSSLILGCRVGYHLLPQLIGEAGAGFLPLISTKDKYNTGLKIDLDGYFHLLPYDISPFVGLGTGAHMVMGGDLGGDFDFQGHLSLGVRGLATPTIALRGDVRAYFIDDYSKVGVGNIFEFTLGIDFFLSGEQTKTPPPPSPPRSPSDRDHDGVIDENDKCPDQTGLPEYQGCIPDAVKSFTGAIKGIYFETGSAKILPSSYPSLDSAVAVLGEYKSVRLRIEGHTDNAGKPAANKKLSEARAESVKKYLTSKGVESGRMETEGYGDTRPVGDNSTADGRAANRRIEFSILGQ